MTAVPCAIALGSNLGDSQQILRAALVALHDPPNVELVSQSSVYQTVPIGPAQPDILNACALINTTLSPQHLLSRLLQIEQNFGRVRRQRWGPRTLDLDLIFYGQVCLNEPNLHVPHPRLRERAFVLVPLADIAPDWLDPVSGQSVKRLCDALDPAGVKRLGTILR
ncbi:2-amino-4-hydroxy-6-hydroxymethyldihydropteridine diphosphokinase [Nodosilinea sp. LEGE 07298]|uniref:2-amino-4-hydroxy-6- hydroxymethyldihydropteridine diphosphokinase n=1 Tax=Nodosilinea sp. LEGE 07298 TaxID=2777970 RepID=UPI0018825824|nr:2-amino-4-hydroxy-6-hydroxymethyldihydropteridine diphosphokinase [Nodosilinea sp. LEGE 07298]MBE9110787.1 2-amino-4-hydroxy-6-hydroxymethyldihydropteridine diphosphokinase [Nodosilinea sp. LEGE 07298]